MIASLRGVGADAPSFVESSYGFLQTQPGRLNRSSIDLVRLRREISSCSSNWSGSFRLATKQSKNCGVEVRWRIIHT
jgi:hypothetical protein